MKKWGPAVTVVDYFSRSPHRLIDRNAGGRVQNEMQHFLEIETGMEMVKIPCEWKKVEAFKWVENISPRKEVAVQEPPMLIAF